MPTAAFARAAYARAMDEVADNTITLSRGATTATVRGRVWKPRADQVSDTVPQAMPVAILLAEDLEAEGFPVPPKETDIVTAGGRDHAITHVDDFTRKIGTTVIAYQLTLAG